MGGNRVENNDTFQSNLQDYKISSKVEIPKLDLSVAIALFRDRISKLYSANNIGPQTLSP